MGRANKNNPAAGEDSLDELKQKLKAWLKDNAEIEGLLMDKMKVDLL
jgi:hypothetical protein